MITFHDSQRLGPMLGLALVGSVLGCGDGSTSARPVDGGRETTPLDGGAPDAALPPGSSPDAGDDAGSSDPREPPSEPECDDETQVRCRGACFDTVGQSKHGCELMLLFPEAGFSGEYLAFAPDAHADGALFMVTGESTEVSRIATKDFARTVLATDTGALEVFAAADGFIYYGYSTDAVRRVSVNGGASQLVYEYDGSHAVGRATVQGEYLYFQTNATAEGLWRVPVIGGKAEQFTTVAVNAFVASKERLYLLTDDGEELGELRSVAWNNPADQKVLAHNSGAEDVFVFEQGPEHVYWYVNQSIASVPRAGGAERLLHDLTRPETLRQLQFVTTTGESFIYSYGLRGSGGRGGLEALSLDGKRRVLDAERDDGSVEEDAQFFYLARDRALFRIAKSGL